MTSTDENTHVENAARAAYDGRMEARFAAIETRIAVVEVDVAVIRTSFATKDDVQRIMAILHEHKLEFSNGFAKQRDDFHSMQMKQSEQFHAALAQQNEKFTIALAQLSEKFTIAMAQQNERFDAALTKQSVDLHKTLLNHIWKIYGFASLLIAGVYYVARYVH